MTDALDIPAVLVRVGEAVAEHEWTMRRSVLNAWLIRATALQRPFGPIWAEQPFWEIYSEGER